VHRLGLAPRGETDARDHVTPARNGEQAAAAVLARLDGPMFVVTTVDPEGALAGCLVGFITQCSIRPVRVIVCLSKLNRTFFLAERSSSLAVHLLGEDQSDVARLFGAQTGDLSDKFAQCDWNPGPDGLPILAGCAAWMSGRVIRRFSVGDHEAFLLPPTAGGVGSGSGVLTSGELPDFTAGHPAE
jgi:flavin reductase (DIM6/NTAB) family NADH-FMN oxidoreductase RutF